MTTTSRLLTGLLATALVAGACTSDDPAPGTTGSTDLRSDEILLTSGLVTVADCDALLDRFIAEGLERVGPYGFGDGWYGPVPFDVAVGERAVDEEAFASDDTAFSEPAAAEGDAAGGADGDFSRTNNQEAGVDEPDLVKTDGERLVVAQGEQLRVIDTTGATPELERTIRLPEGTWATELFLSGDTALLMTSGWTDIPFRADAASDIAYPVGTHTTRIVEVDLVSGQVERTLEFEGAYLSAREIDGTARIVLSAGLGQFPFVYPSNPAAEDSAEEANRRLIEESTIEQWLPTYRLLDGDGEAVSTGNVVECDRMHLPSEFSGFGTLAVLTVDLDRGLELVDKVAVQTDGQTIYASTDRLAVATARWPEFDPATGEPKPETDFETALHTFDITSDDRTSYVASGGVRGHLLNQFSLSEHAGYLRVATTDGTPWGGDGQSESFVTILEERGDELVTVGQVGGLGKGEQIFAVRFIGNTAYVVTFRQIDPLYTVDLSEPAEPTVLGELKIPGFSTYLHPVDDGLLLGVGQDATEEGFQQGAQVSAFDVRDLADPTRIDQLDLGKNSFSAIDWDKKAFTWWAPTRTAFVPVSWWGFDERTNTDQSGNAVVAVRVDESGTLTEIGRLSHPGARDCESYYLEDGPEPLPADEVSDDAEAGFVTGSQPQIVAPEEEYCWSYQPEVRRTVIVGERVFTVSDAGVGVHQLDGLERLDFIEFS